jgi:hypothetical protein
MIEQDTTGIAGRPDLAPPAWAPEPGPPRAGTPVPALRVLVLVSFTSLAAAGLGYRPVALAAGAAAVIGGLAWLFGPLRGRIGGGYALSSLAVGVAGCLLVPLLAWAGLAPVDLDPAGPPPPTSPGGGSSPAPSPPRPTPAPRLARVAPESVTASATAADSVDAAGNPVAFSAEHLLDDNPGTAWRIPGTGVGESVVFRWPERVHLRRIGVIVGYAKRDPVSGADRFLQNRRVRQLLVTLDGGVSGTVDFDPEIRSLQTVDIDAVTTQVTLRIESTTTAPRDFAAMSEVQFWAQV